MNLDPDRMAGRLAHRIRSITVEHTVPVRTGELRNSIFVSRVRKGTWIVGTRKAYARAVHEGRSRVVIRPRRKKALYWPGARHPVRKVIQPPRRGTPFFRKAVDHFARNMDREIPSILGDLPEEIAKEITRALRLRVHR